nr:bifunctional 2-keto-4-hydroxyglutarate aldolase/2-keto-3-deoxy-6-phosphogluconate aldolase [Bacillus alkalicellulosilyticus]
MQKIKTIQDIVESGVVAVIRAESEEEAINTASACIEGGMKAIEVTLTVPGAADVITSLKKRPEFQDLLIGAGSVLDSETARIAILAGATYIVSPCFDKETAKLCNRYQIPYMAGCMTITEMKTAMEYGVDIVKLFPGNNYSPSMINSVKGPMPQVNIMPTGGINIHNAKEWIENGAVAIGIGSDLAKPAKVGDFKEVTRLAKQYVDIVREARA